MEVAVKTHRLVAAALVAGTVAVVPTAASAQTGVSAQDRSFLVAAHQSNLAEIAAGKTAEAKATTATVREHGQRFIIDHTTLDASLTKVASTLGVALPSVPNPTQQHTLASVSALSGAAFDQAWTSTQITGHEQALAGVKTEISSGSNAQVKGLATTAEPVVTSHLAMLRSTAPAGSVNAGEGGAASTGDTALPWALIPAGALVAAGSLLLSRRRA
jgi:putative membrane protein